MTIAELQLGPICSVLAPEDIEIVAADALAEMMPIDEHEDEDEIERMHDTIGEVEGARDTLRDELAGEKCITRVMHRLHAAAKALQQAKAADDCVDPALWTELDDALTACRFVKGAESTKTETPA